MDTRTSLSSASQATQKLVSDSIPEPSRRETLQEVKKGNKENETVTADHVIMLLVIFIRMGYLNNASLYEAWSMIDGGALSDNTIRNAITRNNFEKLWSRLAFKDYENAM